MICAFFINGTTPLGIEHKFAMFIVKNLTFLAMDRSLVSFCDKPVSSNVFIHGGIHRNYERISKRA